MGSLLLFLFRLRAFGLLLALEGVCLFFIVQGNAYQRIQYFNSSNAVVANVYEKTNQVQDYFYLSSVNNDLASENAELRAKLSQLRKRQEETLLDSLAHDTSVQYNYKVAKVINNSVSRINNYITLNKGEQDGIVRGMGVVSPSGVVGTVYAASPNFATVRSLLHSKMVISAEIGRTKAFGTVKWNGTDPRSASLLYIARHLKPKIGDTLVTSSLSTVFPQGVMVGRISKVSIRDDDTFYTIDVQLSANFGTLDYVYVVRNALKVEQDTLEAKLKPEN